MGLGAATPGDAASLQQAFQGFQEASSQLADFYRSLEASVARLTAELAHSRKQHAEELAARERLARRLGSLLDALPGGVVVLDGRGRVQDCNPAARELLGDPLAGLPWREVVARAFSPRWDDGHDISLASGRRVNIATQALDGEPGQILLIKDVTDTRALQAQLSRHQHLSAKVDMAAALAHQIRTPLASALLYGANLANPALESGRRQQFTDKLLGRLRHLERLVEEMLLFARGGSLDTEVLPVTEIIEALARDVEPQLGPAGVELELVLDAEDSFVRANRHALLSAMHNLVNNALQACQGGGRVCIDLRSDGADGVTLNIRDSGPGIPEAERARIFEPFYTTRSQGTGLGLAVVQAVVRAHGGSIALESEAGQGACFRIRLPRVTPHERRRLSVRGACAT